jgi:hypothetical protein
MLLVSYLSRVDHMGRTLHFRFLVHETVSFNVLETAAKTQVAVDPAA